MRWSPRHPSLQKRHQGQKGAELMIHLSTTDFCGKLSELNAKPFNAYFALVTGRLKTFTIRMTSKSTSIASNSVTVSRSCPFFWCNFQGDLKDFSFTKISKARRYSIDNGKRLSRSLENFVKLSHHWLQRCQLTSCSTTILLLRWLILFLVL